MDFLDALKTVAAAPSTAIEQNPEAQKFKSGKVDWLGYSKLPDEFAREAGVPKSRHVFARVIASEAGPKWSAESFLAVGAAVQNEAIATNKTIEYVALIRSRESYDVFDGKYGHQEGRYVATMQPVTKRSLATAQLLEHDPNLRKHFRGAVRFFNPHLQASGQQGGVKLSKGVEDVIESWYVDGFKWIGPMQGINHNYLCLLARGTGEEKGTLYAALQGIPFASKASDGKVLNPSNFSNTLFMSAAIATAIIL